MIRCPNCEQLRDPNAGLMRFERNDKYAMELNVVYQCRKSQGGCGHVFSPGDQRIILAWLSGDLVPLNVVKELQARIAELEAERESSQV